MKRRLVLFLSGAVLIGIAIGSVLTSRLVSGDSIYDQVEKFSTILNMAAKNYVEEVDTQKLTEAAIKGMLAELDPHSVYIPPKEMKRVEEDFRGSFEGIGVEFDIINDTITIVSPIAGGPSEKLGILPGDKIVKIDGENAVGMTREDVPKKLRGPKGTVVTVSIKREGSPSYWNLSSRAIKSRSTASLQCIWFRGRILAISRSIVLRRRPTVNSWMGLRSCGSRE